MDVERLRQQIPAAQRVTYLNSGWSGPSPLPVVEAIVRRLERESYEGPTTPHLLLERQEVRDQSRQAVARFMGATPEEISLCQNTTDGLNVALNGLPLSRGDQLVTCNLEHSSGMVPLYYLRERRGVEIVVVKLSAQDSPSQMVDKFAAALTDRTRLLLVSHISYAHGVRLPLVELNQLAHAHGALVLVDGAQTAGQIPIDVRALDCDFYAIPGHKWLLGPDGVGALFMRRALLEMVEPVKVAGRAAAYYDFEGGFRPVRDAITKFELTTTSGPLSAGFTAAMEFLQELGLPQIEERILHLSALARQRLAEVPGLRLVSPLEGPSTCGLICFSLEGFPAAEVTKHLWARGRIVARTVRETACTRLSLHFFNTEEEVEAVATLLGELASEAAR